jgi:hypothetical protein
MDNTAVTVYTYHGFPLKADDYIMRLKRDDSAGKFTISYIEETRVFGMKTLNPLLENFVLRKAFRNLWQAYKYNQEYISFLLKTSTKEQFLEKAKEFAQTFEEIDENQLYYGANLLLNILDQPLTSADISLFFNIDPNLLDTNTHPLLEYDPESTDTK